MQTFVTVAEERPSGGTSEVLGARAHDRPAGCELHGAIPTWRGMAWSSPWGANRGDHDLSAPPALAPAARPAASALSRLRNSASLLGLHSGAPFG